MIKIQIGSQRKIMSLCVNSAEALFYRTLRYSVVEVAYIDWGSRTQLAYNLCSQNLFAALK